MKDSFRHKAALDEWLLLADFNLSRSFGKLALDWQ